ncbi:hypothetical protein T492DRAFT_879314 [Pavlovales sp. CCMP2436]|nr:hypothetical protein T492DRAFT_879314 [Pavlovales sp. CCMP2436]
MELDRQANALWAFASRLPPGQTRAEGCPDDCTCSAACILFTKRAEAEGIYKEQYLDLELNLQTMDDDYRARPSSSSEVAAEANTLASDAAIRRGDIDALLADGKRKADTAISAWLEDMGLDDELQIALRANFEQQVKEREECDEAADLRTLRQIPERGSDADNDANLEKMVRDKDTLYAKIRDREFLTDDERARARRFLRLEGRLQQQDKAAAEQLAATTARNNQYRTIIDISKSPSKTASKYLCKHACKPAVDEPKRRCSRQDARFENLPDFTLDCGVCGYNGIQNQIQADAHYAGHLNDFYNK